MYLGTNFSVNSQASGLCISLCSQIHNCWWRRHSPLCPLGEGWLVFCWTGRNKHWQAALAHYGPFMTCSSDWLVLKAPWTHTELDKSAFSPDSPNWWNTLQQTLKITHILYFHGFRTFVFDYCVSNFFKLIFVLRMMVCVSALFLLTLWSQQH